MTCFQRRRRKLPRNTARNNTARYTNLKREVAAVEGCLVRPHRTLPKVHSKPWPRLREKNPRPK